MKTITIKRIDSPNLNVHSLSKAMDEKQFARSAISEINWEAYPYRPPVYFRAGHDGKNIYLHFQVEEESIRARYAGDNGDVWTDSCVEFFLQFPGDEYYYNLECNCIGSVLLGRGKNKQERVRFPPETTRKIERSSSLGSRAFELRTGGFGWELSLIVPVEVFSFNPAPDISGKTVRGNFYKCGDELQTPHFLSWNKID
ncbi:MAG: hypothetical protein LBI65_01725, partial [Candidatus Symbiothrix sp.]|nr:hypothetical protein [Candidatus Symbiothrix sp.]